jgi:hypothetical protein
MKITGTGTTGSTSLKRAKKTRGAGQGDGFRIAIGGETPATAATAAVASAVAVAPLLALQELPDVTTERSRAIRRGRDLLDQLDRIRHALLLGTIAPPELRRLLTMIQQQRETLADPQLAGLLDEIELRASVELAKFQYI